MRCTLLAASAFTCAILLSGGAALAQGKHNCPFVPGQNKDGWVAYYGAGGVEPTGSPVPGGWVNRLGGAISGGFYGNTSNAGESQYAPSNGHGVTWSISPGPQTVNGDGPGTGTSIGDVIQACPPN